RCFAALATARHTRCGSASGGSSRPHSRCGACGCLATDGCSRHWRWVRWPLRRWRRRTCFSWATRRHGSSYRPTHSARFPSVVGSRSPPIGFEAGCSSEGREPVLADRDDPWWQALDKGYYDVAVLLEPGHPTPAYVAGWRRADVRLEGTTMTLYLHDRTVRLR